jgi:hypothetical protein
VSYSLVHKFQTKVEVTDSDKRSNLLTLWYLLLL